MTIDNGYQKILLVDDNPNNLFVLRELISLHFPETQLLEALSGAEALALVNSDVVDIILMDVQMPEMDGFETAKLIQGRKKTAHIPIIFVTAFDPDMSRMKSGLEAGGIDYLTKPINDTELIRLLSLYQRFIIRERKINSTIEQMNKSLSSEIQERIKAEQTIRRLNEELENRVETRTAELRKEIEERKKVETQLKQSQTELTIVNHSLKEAIQEVRKVNNAKSMFLASMSHEIRTPMNSILGYTELLVAKETDPEKKEMLEIIHYSGNFLLSLINDILDLSKIEAGKVEIHPEPFSLSKLLCNVFNVMKIKADDKNILLVLQNYNEEEIWINADLNAMSQILMNLVSNAVKFTDLGSVLVSANHDGKMLEIRVSDSGIGIPEDKQSTIFEAFEQAHGTGREGTGLGLAITGKLINLMEGTISVQSKPGEGSTFTVKLPLPVLPAPRSTEGDVKLNSCLQAFEMEQKLHELKLLVVDDNPLNLKLMQSVLKLQGMTCVTANGGKDALEKMALDSFHIVILDIQMPKMDGLEVLSYMRDDPKLKDIFVIALTANASVEDRKRYLDAGFADCLTKPLRTESLRSVFVNYLNRI